MTQTELLQMLDSKDKKDLWLFRVADFCAFFPQESEQNVKASLMRHAKNGYIQRICKGLYANPRALSKTRIFDELSYIANHIRSNALNYLSLETALNEHGVITQIPNRYVFVSTGESKVFCTPYGIIEYVHTKRKVNFHKKCFFDEMREIWVANKEQAIADAYAFDRSVDLIEENMD